MEILTQKSSQATMDSLDLLQVINQYRQQYGESQVRLNDFNARITDELDGEHYESFVVRNPNGTKSQCFKLNIDQCTLVGMRESKAVRKAVLAYIKSKSLPQTFAEALQLAADQARQLELAAPKVKHYDTVVERNALLNASQVAQKIGMSAVRMNKELDALDVYNKAVKRSRVFQQWFIDKGFGELKQTDLGFSQPMFTTKGEAWVIEKLVSEGVAA